MRKKRDWQQLVEEGLVVPYEGAKPLAKPHVRTAWDCCVQARAAYAGADYDEVDRALREAMLIAAESLCYYDELKPAGPTTLEFTERLCREFWRDRFAEDLFARACILGGMLPLPSERLPEEQGKLVRRSISASTEWVALVESNVYI